MKRVWKYALAQTSVTQTILAPRGAKPVALMCLDWNKLSLWCLVDEDAELAPHYFMLRNTGMQVPDRGAEYVASAQIDDAVVHLFQLTAVDKPTETHATS